jgi:hypothetical protein
MEEQMKIKTIVLIALSALAYVAAPAYAGGKDVRPVIVKITPEGMVEGTGSMGSSRNSLDSNQSIGCGLSASTSLTGVRGFCSARSSGGDVASCNVTSPQLIEVIKAITDDSLISFQHPVPTSGQPTCTLISISSSSLHEPKKP